MSKPDTFSGAAPVELVMGTLADGFSHYRGADPALVVEAIAGFYVRGDTDCAEAILEAYTGGAAQQAKRIADLEEIARYRIRRYGQPRRNGERRR